MKYQRIMVAGCSGSGKSTFSNRLGERSGLPVVHLDRAYWQAGWVEPPAEEWRSTMTELVSAEQWIMDGNYSNTWDIRLPRAELIIYLQFPLWLLLWRATTRSLKFRGRNRPDMAPGCPEQFSWSFIHFIILCYAQRKKRHIARLQARKSKAELLLFSSSRQLERWLNKHYPTVK